MLVKIWTASLLCLVGLLFCAWLIAVCREKNIHPLREIGMFFKKQTTVGRILFGVFFLVLWAYASVKPSAGGGKGEGSGDDSQVIIGPNGGSQSLDLPGAVTNSPFQSIQGEEIFQPTQGSCLGESAPGADQWTDFSPITSTNTTRTLTGDDFRRGFVMSQVGTNEEFDFSAPRNAVVCSDWRGFGAATDWMYVAYTNWAFRVATNDVSRLRVYSFGKVNPLIRESDDLIATNYWFSPFCTSLGIVPESNWNLLNEMNSPSQVWYSITPENTLLVTWQNALLERDTNKPISFQVEFKTDGQFVYRYDLSRLNVETVTNLLVGASFAGNAWTTSTLPTNVTSIAFYPLSEEDAYNQDRDGDGLRLIDELFAYGTDPMQWDSDFDGLPDGVEVANGTNPAGRDSDSDGLVDGSDPDPASTTPLADLDGDGIPDAYEEYWFGDTNVVDSTETFGANGFNVGFELASGINPTKGAEAVFMSTNRIAAWKITDGFVAQSATVASNIYERTFRIARNGGWEQFFLSSKPDRAGGWRLEGLELDWEDSEGERGVATAPPFGDSLYLPVSTNSPANLAIRLRATAPTVACRSPLYLLAYSPNVEVEDMQQITTPNSIWMVKEINEEATLAVSIDRSERPCKAPLFPQEASAKPWTNDGRLQFKEDGRLHVSAPGVYPMPTMDLLAYAQSVSRARRLLGSPLPSATNNYYLALLNASVSYGTGHHWGKGGLVFNSENGTYSESDDYPLDSACLWREWHLDSSAGYLCDCKPKLSIGFDFGDYPEMTTNLVVNGETATGTISIGGVKVWSGSATHDVSTEGGSGTDLLSDDGCDSCGGCEEGNCDSLEGASLGSLKFRIPFGVPRKGQISGFAWFMTTGPLAIGIDTLQVLSRRDAHVSDTTSGNVRTIACGDNRGRTLTIKSITNGIEIKITETSSGTLEHTWELTNVNGSSSQIRLRKISRLDHTMSDDTYIYENGDWTKFDNISQSSEELVITGDINADGYKREERILRDVTGTILSHTISESRRFGSFGNAVLRQTYYAEKSWGEDNWNESFASYYTDNDNPKRNGNVRLEHGNARAWRFSAYDTEGRTILTLDQHTGSPCPEWTLSNMASDVFDNADALAWLQAQSFTAIATICDYTPLDGDDAAAVDADKVRTESRYLVENGTVTLIGRTWTRYMHGKEGGYATVTVETTTAGAQDATIADARNARRSETRYDADASGVPLVLRGARIASTDEDGTTTTNTYSISDGIVSQTSQQIYASQPFPTTAHTERCTTYGNILREWSVHTASGIAYDEKRHFYDEKNRLRSTIYADGSFFTNAYSCCRLLWSQDRTGRKVLRSAVTGEDHLYYATEDVSLAQLPHDNLYIPYDGTRSVDNHYRVTQHFMDALGRETNTTIRVAQTTGCATNHAYVLNKGWRTSETTAYPYGVSDYEVSSDIRGNETTTRRYAYEDSEVVETVETNKTTIVTSYRNGSTLLREEWPDGKWKENTSSSSYDANGCRVDRVTLTASDHNAVTLRTTYRDFLGRTVRETTPLSDVVYTYDGTSSRVLTVADSVSGENVSRLYNALGEAIGQTKNGITSISDTDYEVESNTLWRVSSQIVSGSVTNASSVVKERLTGLSNELRSETESWRNGALAFHVHSFFDTTNSVLTEISESATAGTTITKSKFGIVFETTTPAGTTSSFFDPYGRVFYTEKDGRCDKWIGRNDYGDIEEYDTFYTSGTNVYAEFYGYDSFGNRIATTNALGAVTSSAYDAANRIAESSGAVYPVRYGYDTESRRTGLSTTRDGINWDTTTWIYDPATSLCTSKTYADGSTITYTHTPDGKPLRITYPSGRWKENVYDATRQIIGIVSSDGALDVSITRNEFGNVTSESNAVTLVKYSLDVQGNATNEVQTVDGVSVSFNREFDAYGRLMTLTRVGGGEMAIRYAEDGQIATVSNEDVVAAYAYTSDRYDAGCSLALSNNVHFTRTLTRDGYRRSLVTTVTNYVGDVLTDGLAYTYDALNRPVSRSADTFAYNARGEVVLSCRGEANAEDAYAYDNIGNLLYSADHSATNTYISNNRNQYTSILCNSVSPCETSYDLDGNMTQCGEWNYAHDSGNRLVSVASNGTTVATFAYDAQGRRVKKVAADGTHRYFYDGWLLVYEHITRPNNSTNEIEYIWGKDISGTRDGAAGIGGLLYLKHDGEIYVPQYDAYGNLLGYCDAQGNVVASYVYDVFGNIINQSGPMADSFSFRFSTKYFDADCGLYYYGYRYYMPQIMRWLTEDPIGEEGGVNQHLFCDNSGIYMVDIDGRWPWTPNWTEQTARQAVEGKIGEMRKNGYNFAADALLHFLSNAGHNIDLSQHANEISSNIFWQRSFIASVLAKLREKDPKGTGRKFTIGDVEHAANFDKPMPLSGNIGNSFAQQFDHRFYQTQSMGLFYALYGSRYSYYGTASWKLCNNSNLLVYMTTTKVSVDVKVVTWDLLAYPEGMGRTAINSYSAANYLERELNYKTPYIFLRWNEKGKWTSTFWSTINGGGESLKKEE